MWVFTDRGFYSVVQDTGDPSMLVVRARAEGDLVALREFIPDLEIVELPNRDYEFRAYVERVEWEAALVELAERIDYSNFKDAVTARQGKPRHDIYLRIWGAGLAIGRLGRARRRPTRVGEQRQFDLPGESTLQDPWADPDYPSASGSKKSRKRANRKAARA